MYIGINSRMSSSIIISSFKNLLIDSGSTDNITNLINFQINQMEINYYDLESLNCTNSILLLLVQKPD